MDKLEKENAPHKFGWIKCRLFEGHLPSGWVEGHCLVWDKRFFPFCDALVFDPESRKLWKWCFNLDVLSGTQTLVFGNTRPLEYGVLQHREIVWK